MIDNHAVFQVIQSVQLRALKTKTYQKIVNKRDIIYILYSNTCIKILFKSITHQNIFDIYHTFIEVTHIIQAIIICINSLNFGFKKKKSSIKLTKVIKNQNPQSKYNFWLCSIKKYESIKNANTKITQILWGIGALLCQYFLGLSKIFNL